MTGEARAALTATLIARGGALLPAEGEAPANARQRQALRQALAHLREADVEDLLVVAEALRQARSALDRVTGRAGVEDMLDALFGRFCIGK